MIIQVIELNTNIGRKKRLRNEAKICGGTIKPELKVEIRRDHEI